VQSINEAAFQPIRLHFQNLLIEFLFRRLHSSSAVLLFASQIRSPSFRMLV
jgi:hypothetical protein